MRALIGLLLTSRLLGPGALAASDPGEEARGFRGLLAVRGERVLAAENAGHLFVPASVLKLVVAAAALHHLGPEHRVATRLVAGGELAGGTLRADLIVAAAGDPTWSERFFDGDPRAPLAALARQLGERGVERITGDLVVDVSRFPGRPFPPSRPTSELAYGYAAPTSALAVDENAISVEIAPGQRIGEPGTVRLLSPAAGSVRILGSVRTVSRERHGKGTVDFQPVWESSTIVVRGEYPVSEPPYRIELSVPRPDLRAGEELLEALRREGVEVAGRVRVSPDPVAPAGADVLARFDSPPLAALLGPILEDSRNWHAEMLLRLLAAEHLGESRTADGLELERRFLDEVVGLEPSSFVLDDASGLSPYNLLAPEAVVGLLHWIWRQPWRDVLVSALATPGHGTMEIWSGLPPMAGKTGMIRNTVALAGYLDLEAQDREPVIFVCFLNHRSGDRERMRSEIAELAREWRRRAAADLW